MNNRKKKYQYGKCHVCGEQMQEKRINQDFWLKGNLVVIESVPAGVCPQCGEKIVKADVGRQPATLLANARREPRAKNHQNAGYQVRKESRLKCPKVRSTAPANSAIKFSD